MHIVQHALSLLVVAQCVTAMNIKHQRSTLETGVKQALNSKTEQFITAKISSNALKQ